MHDTGNPGALRGALTAFVDSIQWLCDGDERGIFKKQFAPLLSDARAALSAPARNCDWFATAADALDAYTKERDLTLSPEAQAFIWWLFEKGGAE